MRGGEKCLEPLCRRWPRRPPAHPAAQARQRLAGASSGRASAPSFLQPPARRRSLLPLPAARSCRSPPAGASPTRDLVVSLSHCVAKSAAAAGRACRTSATASPRCATPGTCRTRTSARPAVGRLKASAIDALLSPHPRLGPPHRRPRDALRRHQQDRARPHPRVLRPRQRRHLPAGRHRLLHAGRPMPREDFYLVVSALRPVQAVRPRDRGVHAARQASWS